MEEIWKDVPGYEGVYQFSNLDRLRTVDHYDAANRFFEGKILKCQTIRKVKSYNLYKNGVPKHYNVERLRKMLFPEETQNSLETWMPVKGFEQYYKVSDTGKVRSKEYEEYVNGKHVHRYPKELKQHLNSDGYPTVKLRDNKQHTVHMLVASSFLEKPNPNFEVDHKNGNRLDCNLSNLRYISHADNIRHTIELGNRLVNNTGAKNYNARQVKITDEDSHEYQFDCVGDCAEYLINKLKLNCSIHTMRSQISTYRNKKFHGYLIQYI